MKTLLTLFSVWLFGLNPAHAEIVWGEAGPHTGPVASWGTSQEAGIRLAVDGINAAGGISGQKIVVKAYDDACDPKQAVSVANKIISDDIHFVLHGTCSAAALATLKTYTDENTLVINAVSSNPKVTDDGGPNMFRTMYRDDKAASIIADMIIKKFPAKKIAIVNDKSAYGLGVAQYVQSALNKAGIKEITFESYDPGSRDYSVLVTRLKEMGAEAVFIGGYPVEAGLITRQLREAGSHAQIIAGDLSAPEFWKIAGPTGEGALFAFPADPRKEPGAQDVITKLEKSGVVVDGYTLYGYAAAQVLADAMKNAGSLDPAKVGAEIHKGSFKTILGMWSFDDKGDIRDVKELIFRWHNGAFEEAPL